MQTTRTSVSLRSTVLALGATFLLAIAVPQAHADEYELPKASASQVSRAEVIADLHLWQRAGVDRYVEAQQYGMETREYQAAYAEYLRLRNSPAFAQEVARVKGEQATQHAGR